MQEETEVMVYVHCFDCSDGLMDCFIEYVCVE